MCVCVCVCVSVLECVWESNNCTQVTGDERMGHRIADRVQVVVFWMGSTCRCGDNNKSLWPPRSTLWQHPPDDEDYPVDALPHVERDPDEEHHRRHQQ